MNKPLPFRLSLDGYLSNPLYTFVIEGSEVSFDDCVKRLSFLSSIPGFIIYHVDIFCPEDD